MADEPADRTGDHSGGPGPWGTVVLPFGRYFAARADLLTRERFKTVVPIDGISPFTGTGEPDPELQRLAEGDRVNARARTDVRKDLAARFADAHADYLVVDNSSALLFHRELNGRLYTLLPGEPTDLMDALWDDDEEAQARSLAFKPAEQGLTEALEARYAGFVDACLAAFDPAHIVLLRSHAPRFRIGADGHLAPTDLAPADALLLEELDDRFAAATGCLVSDAALSQFPTTVKWQSFDRHRLRRAIEDDVVALCSGRRTGQLDRTVRAGARSRPGSGAADHVVAAHRRRRPVDQEWLRDYFAGGDASYDDLLALAYLKQSRGRAPDELVAACVRSAVGDPASLPVSETRQRFERSVRALGRWPYGPLGGLRSRRPALARSSLRGWRWGSAPGVRRRPGARGRRGWTRGASGRGLRERAWSWFEALQGVGGAASREPSTRWWTPQATVAGNDVVLHFVADGSVRHTQVETLSRAEAVEVVDGRRAVTPRNLASVLGSLAAYVERGRRGITEAPAVVFAGVDELVDTCAWIDWAAVLDTERVVLTTADPRSVPAQPPAARTDLTFVFEDRTRIGTVGGGLGDQITHVALLDDLCRTAGLEYYLDDLRYTWFGSHNGFEAHRLAPALDARRLTRLLSAELVETFRAEVVRSRLPWVYSQSRVWHEAGLADATVVTFDHANARRLMETEPEFRVLVYTERDELGALVRQPPTPVSFYTTQQRIAVEAESAAAIRTVFSYHHLETAGLDPEVAAMAARLRSAPHVALHVRRGDYVPAPGGSGGWHSRQSDYTDAIDFLVETELGTRDVNLAVFSDDLEFVEAHAADYGLDRVTGQVSFVRGNRHYSSVFDSYLMALCPVIVGSVGFFAATTSLLADPPSTFVRARTQGVRVEWRR